MLNTASFAAAQQANVDTLVGLANKTFEGVEQITALNLKVARSNLDQAAETALAALAVKDAQSLFALQAGLVQPNADKAVAYGREVAEILNATKAVFEKVAAEQAAGAQSALLAAVDNAAKNAPEGAAGGVALFKSAVSAANDAFDNLQKAARQATEAAQANCATLAANAVKAAKR